MEQEAERTAAAAKAGRFGAKVVQNSAEEEEVMLIGLLVPVEAAEAP